MTDHFSTCGRRPGKATHISAATVIAIIVAVVVALQSARTVSSTSRSAPGSTVVIGDGASADDKPQPRPADGLPENDEPARPSSNSTQASTPVVETLRIGSWNIEWLGKPSDRSGQARGVAQTTDDLADYVAAARIDVLALQEIVADTPGDSPRSDELDALCAALKQRAAGNWSYILFPGRGPSDQLCGIAWDARAVTPVTTSKSTTTPDLAWKIPLAPGRSAQGSGLWNRPPHLVRFAAGPAGSEKTDFALIVVHMKADYQGDFAAHRGEEAARLVEKLPEATRQFSERDILIIGDTNMTNPDEPAKRSILSAGFLDLNRKYETTHWRGGATDRIFVPTDQPEFADHLFEVMSDRYLEAKRWEPRDFKRRLSDHYMVITTIKVLPDDD